MSLKVKSLLWFRRYTELPLRAWGYNGVLYTIHESAKKQGTYTAYANGQEVSFSKGELTMGGAKAQCYRDHVKRVTNAYETLLTYLESSPHE